MAGKGYYMKRVIPILLAALLCLSGCGAEPVREEPDQAEMLRSQASDILGIDIKLD